MFDHYEQTAEFRLLESIAAALRDELGATMEDQPGGAQDPSTAGQVNRAFRIIAKCLLRTIVDPEANLDDLLNWALDRLARRRLAAHGLHHREIEFLIVREAGGRDDWLAFFVLTPFDEIEEILRSRGPGHEPA